MRELAVEDLGLLAYEPALALMRERVAARAAGMIPDTVLAVRHPPVITVGRKRGALANVLAASDVPVVEVERGGDVTYHGPGQLVLYPIIALAGPERDLHRFLRRLEDSVIATLERFSLTTGRADGQTGVWVAGRKIASIGIAVSHWVIYHGVALNIGPDPRFERIRPCGFDSTVMTSLEQELGQPIEGPAVRTVWLAELARALDRSLGGPR